jgi:hypothetical protein
MEQNMFDSYLEKLSRLITGEINDYKLFIEIQQEGIDLLEQFQSLQRPTIESLRRLGYFKLKIKQQIITPMVEKKKGASIS